MKKIKLFIQILAVGVLLFQGIPATIVQAANQTGQIKAQEAAAAALMVKQKDKAVSEIDRRIASLNQAIEKINNTKKITSEQKTALMVQIQTETTSLSQLKDKIIADTDKATLLNDRKAIVQQYRIFALFLPEIAIISYADKILNIADLMDAKTTDATIKNKITSARTKAQKAISDVSVLKPEEYPGNKSILQASKQLLVDARKELIAVRALMKPDAANANSQGNP